MVRPALLVLMISVLGGCVGLRADSAVIERRIQAKLPPNPTPDDVRALAKREDWKNLMEWSRGLDQPEPPWGTSIPPGGENLVAWIGSYRGAPPFFLHHTVVAEWMFDADDRVIEFDVWKDVDGL